MTIPIVYVVIVAVIIAAVGAVADIAVKHNARRTKSVLKCVEVRQAYFFFGKLPIAFFLLQGLGLLFLTVNKTVVSVLECSWLRD